MAMRAHAVPLPDLQGEPGAVDEGARRWREWAEHFGAAADRVTRIRDALGDMRGEAVQAAVARLDDTAGRALRLAEALSDASHTIGRYAGELHECQQDARKASDDDERAHEDAQRASALAALLAPPRTSGAGGKGQDPQLRRARQRQTEAEEDEAAAVARWDTALDERDAAANAAAGKLDALSAGAATVDGRTGHTAGTPLGGSAGPVVLLAGALSTSNSGGSGPAVAPEVGDGALRDILDSIYAKNANCIGDKKVGTALIHEIDTGERAFGKWHAVDSADQLARLIKLLEGDRESNIATSLSSADRVIALKEAEELWGALRTPMDADHPMAKDLLGNPSARNSISSVDRKMLTSPSMASIAGTEFEANGKWRPVPTQQPRFGRILGGIGAMGGVFDFISTIRLALDPDAANAHLCATGFSWYCNTEPPMA